MMNIKNIFTAFTLFAVILLFSSCEENVTDTSGLIYKEQIVVRAFLYAGENAQSIKITRAVHPLNYPSAADVIPDAEAYIIHNGQEYKLSYSAASQTYSNLDIVFAEGETYQLFVRYQKLRATATTTIPKFTLEDTAICATKKIDEMGILYFRTVIEGVVRDYKNYVFYGMELQNQNDYFSYAYDDLICKTDGSNEPLLVNCYKDNWIREIKDTSAFLAQLKQKSFFIIGFDTPLWNYALTRNNGNTNSDLFGSNLNIDWNVKEDGIGLFIGCNKKKIKEFKFNK